jgi:hypothetical protein
MMKIRVQHARRRISGWFPLGQQTKKTEQPQVPAYPAPKDTSVLPVFELSIGLTPRQGHCA